MTDNIVDVRERWLSRRAIGLHLAALFFVPACFFAAWWQITRATDGNGLSYLYAVEWPIFALLGLYFWWMFIHTDYDSVGLKGMRRENAPVLGEAAAPLPDTLPAGFGQQPDAELADYNARLASLSQEGPKTWRTPERTVVRRSQAP